MYFKDRFLTLTKSIPRFARNTALMLETVRELKEFVVEVIFEKDNISTFTGDGKLMITVLSSFTQDESRSISENSTWGIRRRFEQGKLHINHTNFLGYDKDKDDNLVVNEEQAKIIRCIYKEFLDGKGANQIARDLEIGGVLNWHGKAKWYESSIRKMLTNESKRQRSTT